MRIHYSMNRIARLIGLVLVLVVIFLAAVLASWIRLRRQTEQVRQAAIETRQHQLERTLVLTRPPSLPWSETYIKDLNTILDAQIVVKPGSFQNASEKTEAWHFEHVLRDEVGKGIATIHVNFSPPPSVRLGTFYRHTALILLVVALGLIAALVIGMLFGFGRNQTPEHDPNNTRSTTHQEFDSLTHLAKVSVQRQVELEHERTERLRADEDLHFQQVLLNRALEEKIHLGRELHDGIIQSLYATGLTFEAARKHLTANPPEAAKQLDAGLKALNSTIRDVRSYISGLAPENIHQQSFSELVLSLSQTLGNGRDANFDLRIDEAASEKLSDPQNTNLLQIIRESVSNSLRHGAATKITVRLHESANEICLLVQDNGKGFDPNRLAARGHGLDNIKARADRIQAGLRVTSAPTEGTRIIITLPISAEHTS